MMFVPGTPRLIFESEVHAARHLSVAIYVRRPSAWLAVFAAALPAVVFAQTPTTSLPGTLSGTSILLNASSGAVAITGNSTLSGTVTMNLAFGVEYLVVGGGGGGGGGGQANNNGGGGGGGGGVSGTAGFSTASTVPVLVGNGGAAGTGGTDTSPANNVAPTNGGNSVFFTGTALGGGGGGGGYDSGAYAAASGGSGGGGSLRTPGTGVFASQPGAAGTAGQGFDGGASTIGAPFRSGGGGGAGQAGNTNGPGRGGDGITSPITGSSVYYGGGGGGGNDDDPIAGGLGGGGSGGKGGSATPLTPTSGTANTGGGGGGGKSNDPRGGAAGGSGIVIARYLGTAFASGGAVTSGSGSAAGYTLHTFTTTGSSSLVIPDVTSRLGAAIAGNLTGSGALVFAGPGNLTLSGSNSLGGSTTVSAGQLTVNGVLGTSGVTVESGAILGGSGVIDAAVTVLSGGIVAPGNSPGTLTVNGPYSLADGSILNFELNPTDTTVGGGINDLITGVTNLTLDGILNISGTGDWTGLANDTSWRLFDYSGTLTNNTLSLGTTPTLASGQSFKIDTSTANQVNLVIVPEPGAIALAGIGIAAAAWARRRRHAAR